jgi:ribosome maturation factor RimP
LTEEVTMLDESTALRAAVESIVAPRSMRIWDLQWSGSTLRVFLDKAAGENGPNLDELEDVSRLLSRELDRLETEGLRFPAGRWTLEVSSPGLERALRTPEHFALSIGSEITVRARQAQLMESGMQGSSVSAFEEAPPEDFVEIMEGPLRLRGLLESVDENGIVLSTSAEDSVDSFGSVRVRASGRQAPKEGQEEGMHTMKAQSDQERRVRISFDDLLQARTVFEWASGSSSSGKRLEKVR